MFVGYMLDWREIKERIIKKWKKDSFFFSYPLSRKFYPSAGNNLSKDTQERDKYSLSSRFPYGSSFLLQMYVHVYGYSRSQAGILDPVWAR